MLGMQFIGLLESLGVFLDLDFSARRRRRSAATIVLIEKIDTATIMYNCLLSEMSKLQMFTRYYRIAKNLPSNSDEVATKTQFSELSN